MSCDFNSIANPRTGEVTKLSQMLFNKLNNNKSEVIRVYNTCINPEFIKWAKDEKSLDIDEKTVDGRKLSTIIKAVDEYQSKFELRVIRSPRVGSNRLFPTEDMENHAVSILSNIYLLGEDRLLSIKKDVSVNNIKKLILSTLKLHITNNDLTANQKEFVLKIMNNILVSNDLLNKVLTNNKVISLSKTLGILDEAISNESTSDDESITANDILNDEGYAKDWSDSLGERRDVNKTISKDVRKLFNTTRKIVGIEKVNGTKIYNYDDSTYSGISETIVFDEYLNTIMNHANFDNIDAFIESLHTIAKTYNNRMSLEKIADDCETNKNLANLLYVNFNQALIKRSKFEFNDSGNNTTVANPNSDSTLVIRNTMLARLNDLLDSNISPLLSLVNNIKFNIENNSLNTEISFASNKYNNALDSIVGLYKYLDLGINEAAIRNYYHTAPLEELNNAGALVSMATDIIEELSNAIARNNSNTEVFKQTRLRWFKAAREAQEMGIATPEMFSPEEGELKEVIDNKLQNKILELSNIFSKYQDTSIELNSRNIKGELVSDTIKNSFITKLFGILKNKVSAKQYLTFKTNIAQYEKSNILYERLDNNGNIIIPGLLRQTGNTFELTPYYDFLDYRLFDGAENSTLGNNVTYAEMSKSDFEITAIGMFQNNGFNATKRISETSNKVIQLASYFIQTPSDAPKTFTINSYKLSIKGLISNDGSINRNHPIYQSFKNIIEQERIDMQTAFESMFTIEDGKLIQEGYGENSKPVMKTSKESLYNYYHYNGDVIDSKGNLTGNVFHFYNLITDINSADSLSNIDRNLDRSVNGMFNYLYGESPINQIEDYIDNYIKVKSKEAVDLYSKHKENILDYSDNLVKEFALNYAIQYNNFNELLAGSPKFYKNTKDTIKRNKEVQGSGIIYSAYSTSEFNNSDSIVTLDINADKKIEVKKSFKYATIFNTVKSSDYTKDIESILKKGNVPENIIDFILGKYNATTKVNDAQSYITLDEFVRRVYLSGEYDKYKDTIEALYDETKPIDYNELGKLVQVQKNFYYNLQFNAELNIDAPVQIKNAEFVLIPRFLGNTDLRKLYDSMVAEGIDQMNTAETIKAAQNKIITFWNNDGILTDDGYREFQTKLASNTDLGFYSSLYKQQDTPQHMDDVNKAGVQIVKKMLDNLGTTKGLELRTKFFDLFTANIEDSYNSLIKELGIKIDGNNRIVLDDEGNIKIDRTLFYSMIKDEFTRLGSDSNIMEYANLNDVTGEPNMPSYIPTVRKKIQNIFQSVFTNNVTRQTLPGFHAAQVSGLGMDIKSLRSEGINSFKYSDKLRYHPNGSDYIEVLLPRWNKNLANYNIEDLQRNGLDVMIGYRIPTEGKQSVVKMKVVGFLDEAQGSTIIVPDDFVTQTGSDFDIDSVYGIYYKYYIDSNGLLNKIKYDSREDRVDTRYNAYINSLKLNADLTSKELLKIALISDTRTATLETSKLLAARANAMSFEEFSKLSIAKQNSRDARNNGILDTFSDIMALPESAEENFMSSNFDDIKDAKKEVLKNDNKVLDINSFDGQSEYRNQVMSGAVLKSISVKRDGFTSISNVAKTTITDDYSMMITYKLSLLPVKESKELIANYGKDNVILSTDGQFVTIRHNKLGWSLNGNRNIDGKLITVYSSETTALILDGVKEGGIVNVNMYTFDVFKTFVDLGIDYKTAIAFIAQSGITEIVNQNDATNSIYGAATFNPIGAASKQLLTNYLTAQGKKIDKYTTIKNLLIMVDIKDSDYKNKELNREDMINHIGLPINSKEELIYQLAIIDNFRKYKTLSDEIGAHANVLNTDKIGAGSSIFETNRYIDNIRKLSNKENKILYSNFDKSLINAIYPETNYDNISNLSESMYPSLYAQLKYSLLGSSIITSKMFKTENTAFRYIKSLLPNTVDEKTVYDFENYIIANAMQKSSFIQSNLITDDNGQILSNITSTDETGYENARRINGYGQPVMFTFDFNDYSQSNIDMFMALSPANKVMLLKNNIVGDSIFNYVIPELNDSRKTRKGLQSKHRIIVKDNSTNSEQLYDLFKDLYYSSNPFFKATANDMIRYAVVVEGLSYKYNQVSKIIPSEVLYKNHNEGGTGIVDATNSYLDNYLATNIDEQSISNFFRSNYDNNYIPKYNNKWNKTKKAPNIQFNQSGIARLTPDEASELGLVDSSKFGGEEVSIYKRFIMTNPYKKGVKNPSLSLYGVTSNSNGIYLYPVNKLEKNDMYDISVNSDNNIYPASDIYNKLINQSYNGAVVLPNNLNRLERARLNKNRAFVAVPNGNNIYDNGESILNRYVNIITTATITDSSDNINDYNPAVLLNLKNLDTNAAKIVDKLIADKSKIIIYDNNNAIKIVKAIEGRGYTNYTVVGLNEESSTNKYITQLNVNDATNERKRIASEYRATTVELNKNSGAYEQFVLNLNGSAGFLGLINRVDSQGVNYATVTSAMASSMGLLDNTNAIIPINGIEYLVTNLGSITPKTYKYISDYTTQSELIDSIVSNSFSKLKYAITNIVRIENYQDAVTKAVDEKELFSTIDEVDSDINGFISNQVLSVNSTLRNTDSKIAEEVKKVFRQLNINRNNKEFLTNSTRAAALSTTALFIEQHTNYLTNKFNNFYTDANGKVYPINSRELYDNILLDNSELQQKFCKLLLDINSFITENKIISTISKYSDEDIASTTDANDKTAMIQANESISKIQKLYSDINNITNKANLSRELFFDKVISKISTNPLIQSELQTLTKAYKDVSWGQLWFTDANEANVSIIQVVLKEVNNRLRSAEMEATDKIIAFKNRVAEIESKQSGLRISSLIDDKGRLIQPCTDNFIDDMRSLKETMNINKIKYGLTSIEYHDSKQVYDKWLTDNIEREYIVSYYEDKYNVESILNNYPYERKQIKEIRLRQSEILSNVINNDYSSLSEDQNKELKDLSRKLNDMRTGTDPNSGEYKNNYEANLAVDRYLKGLDAIKLKYEETIEKEGYKEKLNEYIETINALEATLNKSELDKSDTYRDAKQWINANTYSQTEPKFAEELKLAFKTLRSIDPNSIDFRKLSKDKYDNEGVINGNLFDSKSISLLTKRQNNANVSENSNEGIERLIRNNISNDNNIYKREFYNKIKNNARSQERNKYIKDINAILIKYFIPQTGKIQTSDFIVEDIDALNNLYTGLKQIDFDAVREEKVVNVDGTTITKKVLSKDAYNRIKFIKENATFETNNEEYEYQRLLAKNKGKGEAYYNKWKSLNYVVNDVTGYMQPNSEIYSYIKPKDKWIDKAKTVAKKLIKESVEFKTTKYYEARVREELRKGEDSFSKWYNENHIFNINSQTYEPIRIWQQMIIKDKSKIEIKPKSKWLQHKVKDEFNNPDYEAGKLKTNANNGSYINKAYTNTVKEGTPSGELYKYVSDSLNSLVLDKRSKAFISKGYIPFEPIKKTKEGFKDYYDGILESIGIYDAPMKSEVEEQFGKRNVNMPMLRRVQELQLLKQRNQASDETNEQYAEYLKDLYQKNNDIRKSNNEAHVAMANNNYEEVFAKFIQEGMKFNSLQDSALLMRLTLEELKQMQYYKRNSKGNIMFDNAKSFVTGNQEAAKTTGANAAELFEIQMKKLLYNEFEVDAGLKSKISRVAKNLTSLKFMTLNMTGAITNVLYGESQILMETFAKEFIGAADYNRGMYEYKNGITSYFTDHNSETTDNETNAIIKRFNVIDLDAVTEINSDDKTSSWYKNATNLMYIQQSVGEHFMQNSTLLGMLYSHRISNINGKVTPITFEQYNRNTRQEVMLDILRKYDENAKTDLVSKFKEYTDTLKEQGSEEELQKYIYFTKDIVTEYINTLPKEVRQSFVNELKSRTETLREEFEALPTFRSQLVLKDGVATLIDGSELTTKDLANFKNKVISVNHKIHGIYDKLGMAKLQRTWYGSIMFQFHKHMIPGWAKRYGYVFGKGIYSEARESVDKGSYVSLYEFLSTPFKKNFRKGDITNEVEAIEGWRNFGNNLFEFTANAKLYYNVLPEYDKANIRRTIGEMCGVLSAMLMYVAFRLMWDKDEPKTQLADYLMYSADSLASQAQQYTPVGAPMELSKLYSNPVAAFALLKEAGTVFGSLTQYMITGDENILYYKSGTNYGENKLRYNIAKQIPIYNQYLKHVRLGANNSYYKTGQNMLGFIPLRDWTDELKK